MVDNRNVVVIDSDDSSRASIVKAASSLPGVKVESDTADLSLGIKLARQNRPAILVVELAPEDEALEAVERFHREVPNTSIITMAEGSAGDTVLKSLRAGAKEYVSRPVDPDEVKNAVERLLRQTVSGPGAANKVITVFSNKGGTGTSTVAVNLAVAMSRVTGEDVALADFDSNGGEVSLFLNLDPVKTVADLAQAKGKLDPTSVQKAMVKHESGVFVLCEPDRPEQTEGITAHRVREILDHLKASYRYVICDVNHSFNDVTLELFDNSTHILVMTLLNLPAIRSAHRCLEVFRQLKYLDDEDKVRMVVNRYLPNRDIDVAQLEETLGYPVYWKIPNDYQTVIDAVNSGMPIEEVNPETDVAVCYRNIAADLSGVELETSSNHSGGLFSKLLGRK